MAELSAKNGPTPRPDVLRLAAVQLSYTPNLSTVRGSHWAPDEPLLDWAATRPSAAGHAIADLRLDGSLSDATGTTIDLARDHGIENLRLKLKQILDFLVAERVDVAVFPEYLVPVDLAEILIGYREKLAVFAGIGELRDEADLETLRRLGFTDPAEVRNNCAVYVDADQSRVVTKKFGAEGEHLVPGSGIAEVTLAAHGRQYVVGLAICMDYLKAGYAWLDNGGTPQLALVAAMTRPADDFYAKNRDFITVIANRADAGGSAIVVPRMGGLDFIVDKGTMPLPAAEGVVIADCSGYAASPSSTTPTHNRIVHRSAVLYGAPGRDRAELSASSIAEELAGWELPLPKEVVGAYLAAVQRHVADTRSVNELLRTAVEALASRYRNFRDVEGLQLLKTHIRLSQVESESELRYRVLGALLDIWQPALTRADSPPELGSHIDDLRRLRGMLEPDVRPELRATVQSTHIDDNGATPAPGSTFFKRRLIPRNGIDPLAGFAQQLNVLRALSLSHDESVCLIYRLATAERTGGGLVPTLDALAVTRSDDLGHQMDLADGLGAQLEVALQAGWRLSPSSADPTSNLPHQYELRPHNDATPFSAEDWSHVVGYLQLQRGPVSLQLTCHRVLAKDPQREPSHEDVALRSFLSETDRRAAAFLRRAAAEDRSARANLGVTVLVSAADALGEHVLSSIGVAIFGAEPFDVVAADGAHAAGDGAAQTGLRPAEALRLFHPPFELLRRGDDLAVEAAPMDGLAEVNLPAHGVYLGTSPTTVDRAQGGRDIRLPTEARLRHLHIMGQTGAGKTNLLKLMAREDLRQNRGIAVIDPHGDLVDFLLGHVADRENVVLLDFENESHLPVLNPLDLDVKAGDDRILAMERFIQLLTRQSPYESYGSRFEDLMRLTLESINDESYPLKEPTILDIVRILRNDKSRRWISHALADVALQDRWLNFDGLSRADISQVLTRALSKFSEISHEGVLGHVLAGGPSSVSIEQVVHDGGVLLVKIPEYALSRSAAALLGNFIQERILAAVYRRHAAGGEPQPFYLYVDEFQFFAECGFETMIAEGRKFGLGLVLANQSLHQLTDSRFTNSESKQLYEAVMSNVANRVVFSASPSDAKLLSKEMGVDPKRLRDPGRHHAVAQVLLGERSTTLSLGMPPASPDKGYPGARRLIETRMIDEKMWLSREEVRRARVSRDRRIRIASGDFFPPTGDDPEPPGDAYGTKPFKTVEHAMIRDEDGAVDEAAARSDGAGFAKAEQKGSR
ncbi:TraM recognition site of TraD and TraG [Asanoa hainanensis]|uniref:TraM recognition site of TraD and TraG n=1 Tax=Asanoa hainanensis TaxID=560556 RepID=A0A239LHL7_9ACTN|nr:DUF87 domain-containing protein [Asanoa hainanensis]SNT29961.1 TraM recognition site of TraD and TraG [Asanoa hainanensis]